jgi:hypothetical protein
MNEVYRYAAALNFVILAVVLIFLLEPYITNLPTTLFALAVLVCSLTLGMGPALASALLSVTLAGYFFMEPVYSFHVDNPSDLMQLAFLLIMAVSVSSLAESRHRLERTMEFILLLRGLEPELGICEGCSRIQGLRGQWLNLADIARRSGVPLVRKSCPECKTHDASVARPSYDNPLN